MKQLLALQLNLVKVCWSLDQEFMVLFLKMRWIIS